jgi:hypothetical protein
MIPILASVATGLGMKIGLSLATSLATRLLEPADTPVTAGQTFQALLSQAGITAPSHGVSALTKVTPLAGADRAGGPMIAVGATGMTPARIASDAYRRLDASSIA